MKDKEAKPGFVAVLTDESGSMYKIREDAEGGYQQFLAELEKSGVDILVSRYAFGGTRFEVIHKPVPVAEAPPMVMRPGGSTPLLDSIGKVIPRITRSSRTKGRRITLVIITDGEENASVEHKRADIRKMLTKLQKQDDWDVIYLGANQDAFHEAGNIGISMRSTANYRGTGAGAQSAYLNTGVAVAAAFTSNAPVSYSEAQRTAMENPDGS